MKKFIFVMPLLALSLFGCGNKDNPIVNEQEMYDAFALKGVEYLQQNFESHSDGTSFIKSKLSPNCLHTINENDMNFYTEKYVLKENGNLRGWTRDSKEGEFNKFTPEEAQFLTIDKLRQLISEMLNGKKYEDFEYQEDTKEYLTHFHYGDNGDFITAIRFSNKKVIGIISWEESKDRENFYNKGSIEYRHFIPTPPTK